MDTKNKHILNIEDITLDDILTSFEKRRDKFDPNKIELDYKRRYKKELEKYRFVNPYDVYSLIKPGTVIKYTKKNSTELSNASLVTYVFDNRNNSLKVAQNSGYIALSLLGDKTKKWKICPINHYIFYYDPQLRINGAFTNNMREMYDSTNKKYKDVKVNKKTERIIMKTIGMTDKQIQSDANADKLLKYKTKIPNYTDHKVTEDNVDNVVDEILNYNKKQTKNREI